MWKGNDVPRSHGRLFSDSGRSEYEIGRNVKEGGQTALFFVHGGLREKSGYSENL